MGGRHDVDYYNDNKDEKKDKTQVMVVGLKLRLKSFLWKCQIEINFKRCDISAVL